MGVQCIVDLFNLIPYMREHFKKVIADSGRMDPNDDTAMQAIGSASSWTPHRGRITGQ